MVFIRHNPLVSTPQLEQLKDIILELEEISKKHLKHKFILIYD